MYTSGLEELEALDQCVVFSSDSAGRDTEDTWLGLDISGNLGPGSLDGLLMSLSDLGTMIAR